MTLQVAEVVVRGAPSFQLFNRACVVTVGTTQIKNVGSQRGLDVEFEVRTNLDPKSPNTCDLKIWNLTGDTRKAIEQASQSLKEIVKASPSLKSLAPSISASERVIPVRIDAGYVGHMSTIFQGELRSAQTVTSGADSVTELNSGDGDIATIISRVNQQVPGGNSAFFVAKILLDAMGCGYGNLYSDPVQSILRNAKIYTKGVMLKGNAADHVVDLCASVGLEFSLQGGVAQFLSLGQPLGGDAYELTPDQGLIGSPSCDTKGVLSFCSLILPGIKAGGPIDIESDNAAGLYRVTSLEIVGSTFGNDWYCKGEAQRYGPNGDGRFQVRS
jgi:hypothetical protein